MDNNLFLSKNLLVDLEDPTKRLVYDAGNKGNSVRNVHYGQLKLFVTEMWCLSKVVNSMENIIILYVGSAPGFHIPVLLEYFPMITEIHCYDPYATEIKETDVVKIYKEPFTTELAEQWASRENVIFMSDIRSGDPADIKQKVAVINRESFDQFKEDSVRLNRLTKSRDQSTKKNAEKDLLFLQRQYDDFMVNFNITVDISHDNMVWENMKDQEAWMKIIQPEVSYLKFRLPYKQEHDYVVNGEVEYNTGDLYFQPFTTQRGTETRLLVMKSDIGVVKKYNIEHYEQACYYHNMNRSTVRFVNIDTDNVDEIDPPRLLNDWDSTAFHFIFCKYLIMKNPEDDTPQEEIVANLTRIVFKIGKAMKNKTFQSLESVRAQAIPTSSKNQVKKRQAMDDSLNNMLKINTKHVHATDE